jgi:hypothetical protein
MSETETDTTVTLPTPKQQPEGEQFVFRAWVRRPNVVTHYGFAVRARNADEAHGKALRVAQKGWPAALGYYGHTVWPIDLTALVPEDNFLFGGEAPL